MARKATIIIGLILAGFSFGAFLFGEEALRLLYGGQYGGHRIIITVLSISVLASAISLPAASSLLALERPDVSLKSSAVGLLFTMTVASTLVLPMGLLGVVCGLLCGQIAASTVRWAFFLYLSEKNSQVKVEP